MVALKTERRAFMWRITPRPVPQESNQAVTLDEIVKILEAEHAAKRARVYLGEGSRLIDDDDPGKDEKSQIYVAMIKRDDVQKVVTLLINRGDPNAVAQSFIDSNTKAVRVPKPTKTESPGWSAHLVISLTLNKGCHQACFEKMPHVSSSIVMAALDKIVTKAVQKNPKYTYIVKVKEKKKQIEELRRYRPTLSTSKVPSENLLKDLEDGELSAITLTKRKDYYAGPGAGNLITKQEERIMLRTKPADVGAVKAMIKGVVNWGKQEKYDDISFHLGQLPGGVSNQPTIPLDDQDALEHLYVRAMRLVDFGILLEACYAEICPEIEEKMIAVVHGKHGW